jgi:hypothetical protein
MGAVSFTSNDRARHFFPACGNRGQALKLLGSEKGSVGSSPRLEKLPAGLGEGNITFGSEVGKGMDLRRGLEVIDGRLSGPDQGEKEGYPFKLLASCQDPASADGVEEALRHPLGERVSVQKVKDQEAVQVQATGRTRTIGEVTDLASSLFSKNSR